MVPVSTSSMPTVLPPETPRARRHAIPSGPWPWVDFNDLQHEKETVPAQISPRIGSSDWREYPQSIFANWQLSHLKRSKIQDAIEYIPNVCTVRCVDILDSPPFEPREFDVKAGEEDAFWEEMQKSRPERSRLRAVFLDRPSGPALQMVGTKYRIEPFFWSSSLNRLPSRYQEEHREGLGDHITITLLFMSIVDGDALEGIADMYKGSPLPVKDDESRFIVQELLAVHLIRNMKHGNTIIAFHPNGSRKTSAEHLQSRIVDAGRSVYWTDILENTKDPTFILLIFMWYAIYAWDQALEELYEYIGSLELQEEQEEGGVTRIFDTKPTKILHNIHAHIISYQSLLRDFTESINFILDNPNPTQGYGKGERKRLRKECKHLLSEVERLEMGRKNYQERLKNATHMLFSTVNIKDSQQMKTLTQVAVKDRRSAFGMNIGILTDGGHGTLLHYVETAIPLTIFTIWLIVASQTGALGSDEKTRGWERLAWPYIFVGRLLRGRPVSSQDQTASDSTADLEAQKLKTN